MDNLKLTLTVTKGDLNKSVGFLFEENITKDYFLKQAQALVEAIRRTLQIEKVFD